jgi:hypothetical protein
MALSFACQSVAGLCAKERKACGYDKDYFIQRAATRDPGNSTLFGQGDLQLEAKLPRNSFTDYQALAYIGSINCQMHIFP